MAGHSHHVNAFGQFGPEEIHVVIQERKGIALHLVVILLQEADRTDGRDETESGDVSHFEVILKMNKRRG